MKITRAYTRKQAVVVFDHAYHGRTNPTMAMTAKSMPYKIGFGPFTPEVRHRTRFATDGPGLTPLRSRSLREGTSALAEALAQFWPSTTDRMVLPVSKASGTGSA